MASVIKFIRLKVNSENISGSIAFMASLKLYNIIMKLTRSKLSRTKRLLHSPNDKHLKTCSFSNNHKNTVLATAEVWVKKQNHGFDCQNVALLPYN